MLLGASDALDGQHTKDKMAQDDRSVCHARLRAFVEAEVRMKTLFKVVPASSTQLFPKAYGPQNGVKVGGINTVHAPPPYKLQRPASSVQRILRHEQRSAAAPAVCWYENIPSKSRRGVRAWQQTTRTIYFHDIGSHLLLLPVPVRPMDACLLRS